MDYIRWLLQKLININYRKYLRIVTYRLCVPLSCFGGSQSIQRRLEEIEVSFKELEEKGVELEQTLRREASKTQTAGDIMIYSSKSQEHLENISSILAQMSLDQVAVTLQNLCLAITEEFKH